MAGGGDVWLGVHNRGVYWGGDQERQGVCMAGGGMCGRGHAWQGGMHVGEMVTEAVGTHPTGMHSC